MIPETLIEIQICPECFGTGFANHYLSYPYNDRECWKCKGQGEIAIDTNLIRDDQMTSAALDDNE